MMKKSECEETPEYKDAVAIIVQKARRHEPHSRS